MSGLDYQIGVLISSLIGKAIDFPSPQKELFSITLIIGSIDVQGISPFGSFLFQSEICFLNWIKS